MARKQMSRYNFSMRSFLIIALLFLLILLAFSPVWKPRLFGGGQTIINTR